MPRPQKIRVHEKALAHLSRGLYRSPASALRELVSNAWDANARTVRITTDYPRFLQVAVEDNGDGFSKDEFERLMSGNIGNSEKRPKNLQLINKDLSSDASALGCWVLRKSVVPFASRVFRKAGSLSLRVCAFTI